MEKELHESYDEEKAKKLIESLIPMVKNIAKGFKSPDATSVAYMKLVQCVQNIQKLEHVDNFNRYVARSCKRAILDNIRRTKNYVSLDDTPTIEHNVGFDIEFDELINKYLNKEIEQIIVNELCQGYSQRDIAKKLNLSPQSISAIKATIQEKLRDLL